MVACWRNKQDIGQTCGDSYVVVSPLGRALLHSNLTQVIHIRASVTRQVLALKGGDAVWLGR